MAGHRLRPPPAASANLPVSQPAALSASGRLTAAGAGGPLPAPRADSEADSDSGSRAGQESAAQLGADARAGPNYGLWAGPGLARPRPGGGHWARRAGEFMTGPVQGSACPLRRAPPARPVPAPSRSAPPHLPPPRVKTNTRTRTTPRARPRARARTHSQTHTYMHASTHARTQPHTHSRVCARTHIHAQAVEAGPWATWPSSLP